VKHQVVIRQTCLGEYIIADNGMLEIDDAVKQLLQQCDGVHTFQDIAKWAASKEGEPVEDIYEELEEVLTFLQKEEVITYRDSPDYIAPVYNYDRPLSVIWEITYACNQKCQYCIARAGAPSPDELTKTEINTVLNELNELKVGLINITGGEPLLKKETALHIARQASSNGTDLELLTNAMLVTPEVARELYDAGVRHAQVSMDCVNPEIHDTLRGVKGAWKKAVAGIENLRKAGISVLASAVMTRKSLDYFKETKEFLEEIADSVKMVPVLPMGRGEDNPCLLTPEMYYTLLKSRNTVNGQLTAFIFPRETCSIGTTPVITPTGDVYPCMLTKYEELKLGNVREMSIQSIYQNSELLHELFDWTINDFEPCNTCWNRYYCGGGCRGSAFAYYGTLYKKDLYQCEARKKFARELLKRGHPEPRNALKQLITFAKKEDTHG